MVVHPYVFRRKCPKIVDVNRFLATVGWVAEAATAHSAKLSGLLGNKVDAEGG
jgi:hypothetical protein